MNFKQPEKLQEAFRSYEKGKTSPGNFESRGASNK